MFYYFLGVPIQFVCVQFFFKPNMVLRIFVRRTEMHGNKNDYQSTSVHNRNFHFQKIMQHIRCIHVGLWYW